MPVTCFICDKIYANRPSHNQHVREVHKIDPEPSSCGKGSKWSNCCLEENCEKTYRNRKDLICHLEKYHCIQFETFHSTMGSLNEFEHWKNEIEELNDCYYVLKSKAPGASGKVLYYNCNRSKTSYRTKDDAVKKRKRSGSFKMNHSCTSYIKVTSENEKYHIEWQKTHYGHDFELKHVPLPKLDRSYIASKLISGVTTKKILESTRNKIGHRRKRINLLTAKDVRNIKSSFKIELRDRKKHPNAVIRYVRNKSDGRIIKIRLTKGKYTNWTQQCTQDHKQAVQESHNYVINVKNDSTWIIQKNENKSYNVNQLLSEKCCGEICVLCNICSHMYSCDCPFYKERKIICKHIHILISKANLCDHMESHESVTESMSVSESLVTSSRENFNKKINIEKIKNMLTVLDNCDYEKLDDSVIRQIHQNLLVVNKLATSPSMFTKENEFECQKNTGKMIINSQPTFVSIKKQCLPANTSLKNANIIEVIEIQNNLGHAPEDSFIVDSTTALNDHQY